jgi:predicted phosphodiesterase
MRIAAITDIHGNLPALEAVVRHIQQQSCDQIVQLGDAVSGPLWPRETLELIATLDAINIRGNHDREVIASAKPTNPGDRYARELLTPGQLVWMAQWPAAFTFDTVSLFHARPGDDLTYLLEDPSRGFPCLREYAAIAADVVNIPHPLMICGHSHIPRCVRLHTGQVIVNAGSVGLQAYADADGGWHRFENGSPHARYALIECTPKRIDVAIHAVDYDHAAASVQAASQGRDDWAEWLMTGRA